MQGILSNYYIGTVKDLHISEFLKVRIYSIIKYREIYFIGVQKSQERI